jgi:hypothetical protein
MHTGSSVYLAFLFFHSTGSMNYHTLCTASLACHVLLVLCCDVYLSRPYLGPFRDLRYTMGASWHLFSMKPQNQDRVRRLRLRGLKHVVQSGATVVKINTF